MTGGRRLIYSDGDQPQFGQLESNVVETKMDDKRVYVTFYGKS